MKKFLFIILLTINCTTFAFSQDDRKLYFTGIWSLDISKTPISIFGSGSEQDASEKVKKEYYKCVGDLTVEYNEPELKIKEDFPCEKKPNRSFIFFTDERGETNDDNGVQVNSETKLRGNKITVRFYKPDGKGKKQTDRNIEMSISKKGDKLTYVVSESGLPEVGKRGNVNVIKFKLYNKLVYKKLK